MRTIVHAATILCLSVGIASAEGATLPRPAGAARPLAEELSKRAAHEAAVTDCEQMWDRGTHMTKQDWSHACRRVQNRLQQLDAK